MKLLDQDELIKLPISLRDKLNLVLVFADLKLGSEIESHLYRSADLSSKIAKKEEEELISKYLIDNKLCFDHFIKEIPGIETLELENGDFVEVTYEIYYSTFVFAKNRTVVETLKKCFQSHELTANDHEKLGDIFCFPKEAIKAFINDVEKDTNEVFERYSEKSELQDIDDFRKETMGEKWSPYVTYICRKNHPEDYEAGKKWYKYLKINYPKLDLLLWEDYLKDK